MDTQTCIKYLNFVTNECTRHLKDGRISDDELIHFIIELERFKTSCLNSDLPDELKSKIAELKMDYTIKGVERNARFLLVAFLTFGSWAILIHMRQQSKRKKILNEIQFETSGLSSYLRLNY